MVKLIFRFIFLGNIFVIEELTEQNDNLVVSYVIQQILVTCYIEAVDLAIDDC